MNIARLTHIAALALACTTLTAQAQFGTYKDEEVSAGGATTTRSALYSGCKKKLWKDDLDPKAREQCLKVLDARVRETVSAGGFTTLKADLEDECLRMSMTTEEVASCFKVQTALLPPLDSTRREEFGESYDPEKYLDCRMKNKPGLDDCNLYRLRRKPHPEYWPNPSLPRPVIPDGDKKVYRPGMSSEEYFKALCEAEAGEFIYKTVEDVEAVYQIRPREEPTGREGQDRYVLEAPYFFEGHTERAEGYFHGPRPTQYPIFEKPNLEKRGELKSPPFLRYDGFGIKSPYGFTIERSQPPRETAELRSRYAFYWYGIKREMDRQLGVAGGELVVVDLETNEVLALKRGFSLAVTKNWGKGYSPTGIAWNVGGVCPGTGKPPYPYMPVPYSDTTFINRVLKPKNQHAKEN